MNSQPQGAGVPGRPREGERSRSAGRSFGVERPATAAQRRSALMPAKPVRCLALALSPLILLVAGCARREAASPTRAAFAPVEGAAPRGPTPIGGPYEDRHGVGACEHDCLLHEIGYQWAQKNGVTDAAQCGGDSEEMVEGCEAYAEDRQGG